MNTTNYYDINLINGRIIENHKTIFQVNAE